MRLRSHVPSTLKTIAVRTPLCTVRPQWHHRASAAVPLCLHRYSSTTKHAPERIAILGGGISGLASAYFTAKEFPNAEITLFESGKETGGWIKSRRVDIPGEGNVLFELGPRTLRNATPTAMLIRELGLIDQVVYTKRSEPGAQNRFIYYPDQLNRLPASAPSLIDGFNLWRTGMLDGIMGILKEPMVPQRSQSMDDETVGSFLARRTDRRIAENIVSAVFHGIYAGDIWQLSARTLLPLAWELEGLYGSALGGFFKLQNASSAPEQLTLAHPLDLDIAEAMNREIDLDLDFAKELKASSMFTFKDGLQTLSQALKTAVETKGNVNIKTESHIQSIDRTTDGSLGIQITSGPEANTTKSTFDLAVSTLPNADLTPHVTVMTVNLYFSSPTLLPVEGFGYLIPQSVPFEQNPERALGVIFDSSAIKGQDTAPGTKVTVMLGGHWWDTWTEYPTEEEGLEMARSILRRHLNIEDEPVAHVVNLSNKCIPQYTLGYAGRLRKFAENMKEEYKGRLRITGSQYNGVGVNDCITGAWNIARGLRGDGWKSESCGLDKAMDNRKYVVAAASELAYSRKVRGVGMDQMDGRGDGGV